MTISLKEEFVVDADGKPRAVLLSIKEYKKLLRLLEDMEDALDLKKAIETNKSFISHKDLKDKLRKQGLL